VSNYASWRKDPHIKVTAVASRWQRVGDLIGSGFEPHTGSNLNFNPYFPCQKQTSYRLI